MHMLSKIGISIVILGSLLIFPSKVYAVTVQNYQIDTNTAREKVGYPAISDPSSYIVFPAYSWTTGGASETLHHGPIASGGNSFISNKAEPAATVSEQNKVFISVFDLGVEPGEKIASYLETGDTTSVMQWQYLNGKPSGIFNYQWYRSSLSQSLNGYYFTYQDRFYGKHTLNGINYFGFSIRLTGADASNNLTGAIDTSVPGQPIITIYDAYSGYYVAFGASQVDEYYVDSVYEDPRYTLNTAKTSTTNSVTFAGLRATNLSGTNDSWNYVFAMSRVKVTAIVSVRSGLNNFDSDYASAQTFWQGYLNDTTVNANLTPMTEREKYDACVALNQLAANSYNQSYLAAGTPIYSDDFARDTAYTAMGLYYWKPTFAKDILKWFAQDGWPSIVDTDAVDKNGVAIPGEYPTDWGAVYMYAAGKIYKLSGDTSFANTVKTQLNNLYDWVHARYNTTDKHIDVSSSHTHDYWDQYAAAGTIDTSLIKYEAEIDMLWALALENAAGIWTAVGDTTRASWAAQTASDLRTKLSDYRTSDNGFYFAIKTDNSLYNDFVSAPTNLVAARFMDDLSAFNYLTSNAANLSLAGIPWVNIGSTTYKNGVTNLIDIGTWFEISWGSLSKRWGDGNQYTHILTMTGLGYVPGSLRAESNDYIVGQHVENQSWSYGLLLGAIYDANFTYPTVSGGPSTSATSNSVNITWNTKNYSSSFIDYGLTSNYSTTTSESDTSPRVSAHSITLSGLNSCTQYHYRVKSNDVQNLLMIGDDKVFTTPGCPVSPSACSNNSPLSAPYIYSVIPKGNNSVLLNFTEAQDPVDKYVLEYGTVSGQYIYGSPDIGGKGTTSFLVGYLVPGKNYYFRLRAGNGCATGPWSNEIKGSTGGINYSIQGVPIKSNTNLNQNQNENNNMTQNIVKQTPEPNIPEVPLITPQKFSCWEKIKQFFLGIFRKY